MKTCQELTIEYTEKMRTIVEKYNNSTQYLLPIIIREDGTERKQYKNQLVRVNRNLKKVGELAGLNIPLTSYVSRHAWASIARNKNIPLNIISKGLGHNNESTTQIYLDSIKNSVIDKANRSILDDL
jgi:site-specific recombinase XerD